MILFYLCKTCGKTYPKDTSETFCCKRPLVLSLDGEDLDVGEVVHYFVEAIVDGEKRNCFFCNLVPIVRGNAITDWDLVNCKRCLLKKARISEGVSRSK